MQESKVALTCDWCKIGELIPWEEKTKVKWVRLQAYQLVGGEAAHAWDICAHCWSIIEARRLSLGREAKEAKR